MQLMQYKLLAEQELCGKIHLESKHWGAIEKYQTWRINIWHHLGYPNFTANLRNWFEAFIYNILTIYRFWPGDS